METLAMKIEAQRAAKAERQAKLDAIHKEAVSGFTGPVILDAIFTVHDKPLAAAGLTSYRYKGAYGWIMIGAKDAADALNEANRSLSTGKAIAANLEIWDGAQYRPA
jgi:hypothetical protein